MTERNHLNGSDRGGSRRAFLAGAASTAAYVLSRPGRVRAADANSALELGMIGCGGRGNWIADLFQKNINCRFVACADYYQDRVDAFGEKFGVEPARRYTTLSCYKKLLEGKLDAVVIESPPYCHPEQAAAAVDAGRHVFLAKPVAIDVPGCTSVADSGKKAAANKLVFLVDFQTRANPIFKDAIDRVHKGAIGEPMFGESLYYFPHDVAHNPQTPDERLRLWYTHLDTSGDFIVEQNVHTLDIATWILDAHPFEAIGAGGRKLRKFGNIWDHFQVLYRFPNDISINFTGTQCIPKSPDILWCRVCGTQGTIEANYYGKVEITGLNPFPGGTMDDLYTQGAVQNIKDFARFIHEKVYDNTTVAPSVRSNLTAILGREAGYKRGPLTWDELIKANKKIPLNLEGLKA